MLTLPVEDTLQRLLRQEDSDGDHRITIHDHGPKVFEIEGAEPLRGTYQLSNLLQELALARAAGAAECRVDAEDLRRNPLERISTAIRDRYWRGLTRRMDADMIDRVLHDPKGDGRSRLYLPPGDAHALAYYGALHQSHDFEMIVLPDRITPSFVTSCNHRPGLLGLAFDAAGQPLPYVVPGGRFNEMYGWDSYFICLGLIHDGHVALAQGMLEHMCYQIEHYGQILNANRTYYLSRSQPPFLTSLVRALLAAGASGSWLERAVRAAAREYAQVWMGPTRLTDCGLSRYFDSAVGFPPETLMRHYGQLLAPFAEKAGLSIAEYRRRYEAREFAPPELDAYFCEDRSVRESGHDTSYRLEGISTQLCPVDLNSLIYRYERDLAAILSSHFGGSLPGCPPAAEWNARAQHRRELMTHLCWDPSRQQFFDYNWREKRHTDFESATNYWPLWAGLATREQARSTVESALPRLVARGGVMGTTEASRGTLSATRTARQWDYPYGWAPHQMLIWEGLKDYGYDALAAELALRWVRMVAQNAVDFNGVIPEKYDLVLASHEVHAEYGNQGADFKMVVEEGFGWTNSSFQMGLTYLDEAGRKEIEGLKASDEA